MSTARISKLTSVLDDAVLTTLKRYLTPQENIHLQSTSHFFLHRRSLLPHLNAHAIGLLRDGVEDTWSCDRRRLNMWFKVWLVHISGDMKILKKRVADNNKSVAEYKMQLFKKDMKFIAAISLGFLLFFFYLLRSDKICPGKELKVAAIASAIVASGFALTTLIPFMTDTQNKITITSSLVMMSMIMLMLHKRRFQELSSTDIYGFSGFVGLASYALVFCLKSSAFSDIYEKEAEAADANKEITKDINNGENILNSLRKLTIFSGFRPETHQLTNQIKRYWDKYRGLSEDLRIKHSRALLAGPK